MRPERTDLDVLAELVALDGRDILDVGCGDGALVRALAARGARAQGLEVTEREGCLLGSAAAIPLADAALDAAILMRSFHHVPGEELLPALHELRRVLRPGGDLYVAEPLPEGALFELMRPVDDETEVRAAAQAALARAGEAGFEPVRTLEYDAPLRLSGFGAFRARMVAADPAREQRFAQHDAALREAFAARVGAAGAVRSPMRAALLRAMG